MDSTQVKLCASRRFKDRKGLKEGLPMHICSKRKAMEKYRLAAQWAGDLETTSTETAKEHAFFA